MNLLVLKKKKTIAVMIVVLVVLVFAAQSFAKENGSEVSVDNTLSVDVYTAAMESDIGALTYQAELEPLEEVVLGAKASGQVTKVLFEDGKKVLKGQPLIYLDDVDLQNQMATAQVDLNQLKINLNSAKHDYDTISMLYDAGAVSKTDLDSANLSYQTALSNVSLKELSIEKIQTAIADCVICAAMDGEASGKNVTIGEYVNPGTVLGTIKNNETIKATVNLMQDDLEQITIGQAVTVKTEDGAQDQYKGSVVSLASSANSDTRVFPCIVELTNDGSLHTGVKGVIEFPGEVNREMLVIPTAALMGTEGEYQVFVFSDGVAQSKDVEIGTMSDNKVEIVNGIDVGDLVITTNLSALHDGDLVKVSGEVS